MTAPFSSSPAVMTGADAYREAVRLDGLGRYAEAQKLCQQLLKAKPDLPDVHHLLGVIFFHAERFEDATRHLKQALKLKPDLTEAAFNLSKVYYRKGKWPELLAALETVHQAWPDRAGILIDIGLAQEQVGDIAAATATYRKVLERDPLSPLAHSNLGAILTRQDAVAEAETHLKAAMAVPHPPPAAFLNMAMLHEVAERRGDVIAAYDALIATHPDLAHAHFQRALSLLNQECLAEGWREYAWRFRRPESRTLDKAFPIPYWQGESLQGHKLLIWTEQGPGDEILLASMIPDVLAQGAEVLLICSPRLVPLFRRSFEGCRVISHDRIHHADSGVTQCTLQASFSHLGAVLRPAASAFPQREKYLTADAAKRATLRARYQSGISDRKLIGIAWHSANASAERQKSAGLDAWAPILKNEATFVSLQYGDHAKNIRAAREAFGCEIIADKSIDALKSIDDFAAQVAAMDHVVTVSNTTVHVAGALGVPTFALIPQSYGRLWYWFLDRTDSPWYPSLRLFRQHQMNDWAPAIAEAGAALSRALGA